MSETINWNYSISVISGPQVSNAGVIGVDAYDKFTVTIDKNASQTVELIPGADTWQRGYPPVIRYSADTSPPAARPRG